MLSATITSGQQWAAIIVGVVLVVVGLWLLYRKRTGKVELTLPKGITVRTRQLGVVVTLLGVACVGFPFLLSDSSSPSTGNVKIGGDVNGDVITGGRDVTVHKHEGFTAEEVAQIVEGATATLSGRVAVQAEELGKLKEQHASAIRRAEEAERQGQPDAEAALQTLRESGDTDKLLAFLIEEDSRAREDTIQLNREIAAVAYLRGEIDTAESAVTQILRFLPDDLDATNWLGRIHMLRGQLDDAKKAYERVLVLARAERNEDAEAVAYGNLALVYQTRGDLDKAEEFHRESLKIYLQLGRLEGMASNFGNLALVYQTRGDLDKAEEFLRKALEINEQLGRREGMAKQYGNLGLIYRMRGDLDKAEEFLRKA
ncbi:MAG: tetratricopeptide repeat protein, partial [Phycisphaerae bacterium]